ncbi:MbeB family mobilization protein, partial [Aeromonas salmonicida]
MSKILELAKTFEKSSK